MHALLQTFLNTSSRDNSYTTSYGGLSSGTSFSSSQVSEIYKRIMKMQDLLLKSVVSHDAVIQEKIAELALTGDSDETKV